MDHIFGDSHDIAFGANTTPKAKNFNTPVSQEQKPRHIQHDDFADLSDTPVPQRTRTSAPAPRRAPVQSSATPRVERPRTERAAPVVRPQHAAPLPEKSATIPLASLIDGMKSSFLPREEDTSVLRVVALS